MPGKVPVRPGRLGQVPMPGWTDENEWQGWIPFEELPSAFNPEGHYLASANNKVAGIEYPHLFSCEQYDGVRARRITDLLEAQDRLSAEDFARIRTTYTPPRRVRPVPLARPRSRHPESPGPAG